jgi:thiamine biosynthesis lipoprotein
MMHTTTFRAMGCKVEIKLEAGIDSAAILETMPQRFDRIENHLTRFHPQSELMQLNSRAGEWVSVSEILFANLFAAKQAARLTNGLFNPLILPALIASGYDRNFDEMLPTASVPTQPAADWRRIGLRSTSRQVLLPAGSMLDLGGIAKGWAAQHIASDLAHFGPNLVNIGGDIVVHGAPEGSPGWQIDVADPGSEINLTSLWLRDAAVVTSGIDYRRWLTVDGQICHHIINPFTGVAAQTDVLTVTVIHPHAPTAEAYAKVVLLKGSDSGLVWLNDRWNAAGLVIRQDGAVVATSSFAAYIQ